MKNKIIVLSLSLLTIACKQEKHTQNIKVKYPTTIKKPIVDTYFNTEITDNYRWLEDDRSK